MRIDFAAQPIASFLVLFIMVFWLGLADSLQRVVKRIRDAYPVLWDQLGAPESLAFSWLVGPFVFTLMMMSRQDFVRWLVTGQYADLRDKEILKYVARLRRFFALFAAGVISIVLYAMFQLALP